MNYQHVGHGADDRLMGRATSAAQHKKAADAKRIEELNRLTRYPSLLAVAAAVIALLAAAVHIIR